MGLGGSAGVVVSRAIVRDLFEEREAARFYSLMMIIGGIGPICPLPGKPVADPVTTGGPSSGPWPSSAGSAAPPFCGTFRNSGSGKPDAGTYR